MCHPFSQQGEAEVRDKGLGLGVERKGQEGGVAWGGGDTEPELLGFTRVHTLSPLLIVSTMRPGGGLSVLILTAETWEVV